MCPECGSEDVDIDLGGYDLECQECGARFSFDELEED